MILAGVFLVWAAVVLGDGKRIDCNVSGSVTEKFVPGRLIATPGKELADDPAAFRSALQKLLKTGAFLPPVPVGSDAFIIDSTSVDLSKAPFYTFPFGDDRIGLARDPYIFEHGTREPDDPHFAAMKDPLWGLRDIAAPTAWFHDTGSDSVVAAVVDGGIQLAHEDLKPTVTTTAKIEECPVGSNGYDALDNRCVVQVRGSHGTRMAGAIGGRGNNKTGVVGVNWNVGLLSSGFMVDGVGCASAAANALRFVRLAKETGAANVRVLNLSWGSGTDHKLIWDELQQLSDDGVVLVTSAGNDGKDIDTNRIYPARYALDTLIAVAYTNEGRELGNLSNYGKESVHVAAPGVDIVTTSVPGGSIPASYVYKYYKLDDWGTSIAAAHVTGAIALLASACPNLTGIELKKLLLDNADTNPHLVDKVKGQKSLNVGRAMCKCVELRTGTDPCADAGS